MPTAIPPPPRTERPRKPNKLAAAAMFAGKFVTQGVKVASIAPSSRFLAAETIRDVDPGKKQVIVDLGAGTGPITEAILEKMHPESVCLSVEMDPDFARHLRAYYPRATVIEDSAGNLAHHLKELGLDRVDVMCNCLPSPSIPREVFHDVLRCYRDYGTGPYTQITEIPWFFLKFYRRYFEEVRFQFVTRNIPPSGVYHCRRLRDGVLD